MSLKPFTDRLVNFINDAEEMVTSFLAEAVRFLSYFRDKAPDVFDRIEELVDLGFEIFEVLQPFLGVFGLSSIKNAWREHVVETVMYEFSNSPEDVPEQEVRKAIEDMVVAKKAVMGDFEKQVEEEKDAINRGRIDESTVKKVQERYQDLFGDR